MHHVWGLVSTLNKMTAMTFTECLLKIKFFTAHCCCFHRYTCVQSCLAAPDRCCLSLRTMESCYTAQFIVKITGICEFRVIMEIMTGMLRRSLWSTHWLRANAYVNTIDLLGCWLHHSPWALGCFRNNARAAPVIIPQMVTNNYNMYIWIM